MTIASEQTERVRVVEIFFKTHPEQYKYRREAFLILDKVKKRFPNTRIAWASWEWPRGGERCFSIVIKDPSFAMVNAGQKIPALKIA